MRMIVRFLIPLTLLSTAACGSTVVRAQTVKIAPPAELLTCRDAPVPPPAPRRQVDVALYIADLRAAHQDCRETVREIEAWVRR